MVKVFCLAYVSHNSYFMLFPLVTKFPWNDVETTNMADQLDPKATPGAFAVQQAGLCCCSAAFGVAGNLGAA